MKQRIRNAVAIIAGLVVSMGVGIALAPDIFLHPAFLWGAIFAIALLSTALLLTTRSDRVDRIRASALIVLVALGCVVAVALISKAVDGHLSYLEREAQQADDAIEAVRLSEQVRLMGPVLEHVDRELLRRGDGSLSDSTIARLAALSYSLRPRLTSDSDSTKAIKQSIERGQLLMAILHAGIDTMTLQKIYENVSFAYADLPKAELDNAFLTGIDLRHANLTDASLRGSILHKANMQHATFWGADLRNADLTNSEIRRSDMRWATLVEANLTGAVLQGADLSSAKLNDAILNGVRMRNATLADAFIRNAALNRADLREANLVRANFEESSLTGADIRRADLTEASLANTDLSEARLVDAVVSGSDLSGAQLNGVLVLDKDWPENLSQANVHGASDVQVKYSTKLDSFMGRATHVLVMKDQNQATR